MSRSQTRKIRLLLAATTLIPIGVLLWLGVRTLAQEQDAELQRARERLEVAAGRLALDLDRKLVAIEEKLARGEGIRFMAETITPAPDLRLLYGPQYLSSLSDERLSAVFLPGETEESQHQNLAAAAATYDSFTRSPDPAIRAGALVRLARVLRKKGDAAAALQTYKDLEQLGLQTVGGEPAALLARQGRGKIFEETGNKPELLREAGELARLLYSGTLPIDRATFDSYRELIERWGGPPPPNEELSLTEATIRLWQDWRGGELPARGRRILSIQDQPILAVWDQQTAWLLGREQLQALIGSSVEEQHLRVALLDPSDTAGQPILGAVAEGGVSLTPAETRLPFTLRVSLDAVPSQQTRTVLLTGLVLTLFLMIAAAVTLYRVTMRELMLARQQSDFVSAVSHEFRTPLTSMRHLTDLLVSRGITNEERREHYYSLLAQETERLHRMVESLLSFGRIEAGAYAWRLESIDAGTLVRNVVEEFSREPLAAGREIRCDVAEPLPEVRVDRDSLSRALWNLLENAAKYSEAGKAIQVHVRKTHERPHALLLAVEDEGAGIPASEREKIFQKFMRGAEAKRAGVRGVGIGLALVKRIVEAHGGTVRLESEPGRGSTFTMVIPCLES